MYWVNVLVVHVILMYWLPTFSYLTVADPSPDPICDPLSDDCSSSPPYLIEVMSQLLLLTVKTSELVEPASTTILLPLWVTPKAARPVDESVAAANIALLRNMTEMMGHSQKKRTLKKKSVRVTNVSRICTEKVDVTLVTTERRRA